jgi:serine/threonine-protein kinase
MSLLTNALIGEYRLAESLGAGGMGEVYKAVHTHLGRVIAVKVLSPNLTDGPALQRFYNEASIQASLRHPSVAEYLGFHEYQGRPCILMEYVDGETLAAIIQRRGPLPPPEAAGILRDIASAIAHFHAQGVVHRDLKTGNIKITTSGQVKILDFGIARHQRSDRLTHLGAVVGTTEFLAPEQVRGEPAGFPTDVWQLGVVFYELLTGRLPFQADSPHEVYRRILAADYVPIRRLLPDAPDAIVRIVSRCLQKDMSRRYPTAAELHQALCSWERSETQPQRPWLLLLLRHRAWSALAGLLILAIIIALMLPRHRAPDNGSAPIDMGIGNSGAAQPAMSDAARKIITIDTMDGPAQVLREGKPVGSTPYKVDARMGDGVDLILRRDGFEDLPVRFEVTERHVYTYILKPRKDR